MIQNYTVQTFVAWWIGASIGFLLAQLTVGSQHWNELSTLVLIYTLVLYTIYGLSTVRGQHLLTLVKRKLSRKDAEV